MGKRITDISALVVGASYMVRNGSQGQFFNENLPETEAFPVKYLGQLDNLLQTDDEDTGAFFVEGMTGLKASVWEVQQAENTEEFYIRDGADWPLHHQFFDQQDLDRGALVIETIDDTSAAA